MMKECVICNTEFQSNWHLRRHMGRMHPDEDFIPIYTKQEKECVSCGVSFTTTHTHRNTCGLNKCAVALYRKRHPERIKASRQRREHTDGWREKRVLRMSIKERISSRIGRALRHSFDRKGINKKNKSFELLGYSADDLKAHLEPQFTDDMSWGNMSEWHIDHIRPIASFNFDSTDHPDFKKCWALNNLQPLWAVDNMSKGDRWNGIINA